MREIIKNDIEDLLIKFSGDGHTDGSKEITEYIVNLVNNKLQDAVDNVLIKKAIGSNPWVSQKSYSSQNYNAQDVDIVVDQESILKLKL